MMMEHEAYKGLIDKLEFDNRGEGYMWCEEPLAELVNDTADLAVETARRTCDYTAPSEQDGVISGLRAEIDCLTDRLKQLIGHCEDVIQCPTSSALMKSLATFLIALDHVAVRAREEAE